MVKFNKIISDKLNVYKFIVISKNDVLACTTITNSRNYVTFSLVEVDKKHRRKGIGKQMLMDCITFCDKKWPNKKIILEASPYHMDLVMNLDDLIKFYESVGFEVTKRKKETALMGLKK